VKRRTTPSRKKAKKKTGKTNQQVGASELSSKPASNFPGSGNTWAWGLIALLLMLAIGCDLKLAAFQLSSPLVLAFALSWLVNLWGIPKLKALKMGQVIRQEGPQSHHSKSGTPTMGGLLLVPCGVLVAGLVSPGDQRLLPVALVTLAFMVIGGVDDWSSLTKRTNTGLSAKGKLLLQAIAAASFLVWAALNGALPSGIALPFGWWLPLGVLIWPLALFVFLAESNATNLTDGLDGLAAGVGAIVFMGLGLQLMLRGNGGDPALAGFCAALAGAWLGFLVHNRNPARVFMGDTGSLAMGAALSAIALLSNSLWPLLLMGGVLLAESLSVILQVWVFKATKGADGQGRRLFRMAPLHHHFELGGWGEIKVVVIFWLVSLGLVALGLLLRP
jgi:phospho-N-acetylmuramoyl-pentapeptide-transferase